MKNRNYLRRVLGYLVHDAEIPIEDLAYLRIVKLGNDPTDCREHVKHRSCFDDFHCEVPRCGRRIMSNVVDDFFKIGARPV